MKILIHGDMHGDANAQGAASNVSVEYARTKRASSIRAVDNASRLGCEFIIQVGDFGGTWPGWFGMVFTDRLNAALIDANIRLIWLDGNHEGFDAIDRLKKYGLRNTRGQLFLRSNILYSPRGTSWIMDNKRFMTIGGAYSIDKEWRTVGESWWPQEQLTDQEVLGIVNNAIGRRERNKPEVDYLFTHDCHPHTPFKFRLKNDPESNMHRDKIKTIVDALRPRMWWHGHMHEKYDWTLPHGAPFDPAEGSVTKVYGLADGVEKDSWGILDTETDTFTFESERRAGMFDE